MATQIRAVTTTWHGKEIYARFVDDAFEAVSWATEFLTEKIKENVSFPGRAIGHPYARAHRGGSYNAPFPWSVHAPGTGLMVRPSWVEKKPTEIIGKAGLHSTLVARSIVYGTSRMRPRNVVRKTLGQHRSEIQRGM